MEAIEKIKELIQPILSENKIKLYDVKWTSEKNNKILQISILKEDDTMDLDTCALISEKISVVLDELLTYQYMLEVCSPGAEREIKNFDEIKNYVGKYIFVRLNHSIKGKNEFTGEIESVDDLITINYRDKAVLRKVSFETKEIEFIRFAVKI